MGLKIKNISLIIGIVIIAILAFRLFNQEPKTVTTIKTEYVNVFDTITKTVIEEKSVIRYVYIKNDSLVYVKKEDTINTLLPIIKANEYSTTLESNNATANLSILTTGKLLDVQGTINFQKEIRTVETTKYINNSSLFLYGETSIAPLFQNYGVGIDYVIKDKFIIGSSLGYDVKFNSGMVNIKFGIKIF